MVPTTSRSGRNGPSLKFLLLSGLLLICSFIAINGGLYESRQSSVISALKLFMEGEPGTDSWTPMREASDWLKQSHSGTVYEELFFNLRVKFQYPPSSLLVFSGLGAVGIEPTNALLNAISWFAVLITVAAVALQASNRRIEASVRFMSPSYVTPGAVK